MYKNNPKVLVYAVNIPIKRDTIGQAINAVKVKKYSFTVLIGNSKMEYFFNVQGYPTTFVVRNDTVLFKGDIEQVDAFIKNEIN